MEDLLILFFFLLLLLLLLFLLRLWGFVDFIVMYILQHNVLIYTKAYQTPWWLLTCMLDNALHRRTFDTDHTFYPIYTSSVPVNCTLDAGRSLFPSTVLVNAFALSINCARQLCPSTAVLANAVRSLCPSTVLGNYAHVPGTVLSPSTRLCWALALSINSTVPGTRFIRQPCNSAGHLCWATVPANVATVSANAGHLLCLATVPINCAGQPLVMPFQLDPFNYALPTVPANCSLSTVPFQLCRPKPGTRFVRQLNCAGHSFCPSTQLCQETGFVRQLLTFNCARQLPVNCTLTARERCTRQGHEAINCPSTALCPCSQRPHSQRPLPPNNSTLCCSTTRRPLPSQSTPSQSTPSAAQQLYPLLFNYSPPSAIQLPSSRRRPPSQLPFNCPRRPSTILPCGHLKGIHFDRVTVVYNSLDSGTGKRRAAKAKRDEEYEERKKHAWHQRVQVEYHNVQKQVGAFDTEFNIVHVHKDSVHEEELLKNKVVLAPNDEIRMKLFLLSNVLQLQA
ncbi:hypothetical protein DFH27DRAFT_528757 [Peziza echinospora]|nr:hypothetical protein DFH27DRAFT_528757 [Peziza echinospora]